jgi:hypothetical protein
MLRLRVERVPTNLRAKALVRLESFERLAESREGSAELCPVQLGNVPGIGWDECS